MMALGLYSTNWRIRRFRRGFKLNAKCICILCVRSAIDAHPGRLLSRPDQPSRINGDASFERLERVNPGCYRLDGIRMVGRGELVGAGHDPCSTTDITYDKDVISAPAKPAKSRE